ncbi:MAG: Rid family hydrolase, partial [Ilumatobacteraceae bacterium]
MNKPLGPYSPFVRAGDFVIVSGQGGMRDGAIVPGGVAAETTQTMQNVADRLGEAGAALGDVVKT